MITIVIMHGKQKTEMRKMTKKISNAEREVMEVLWEKSPQSAQEVIEILAPLKDLAGQDGEDAVEPLVKEKDFRVQKGTEEVSVLSHGLSKSVCAFGKQKFSAELVWRQSLSAAHKFCRTRIID